MKKSYTYEEHKILTTIGDRIATERKKQKLTRYAFAMKTGLHQQTVKLIEEGKINPSVLTLEILTRALDIHVLI